ncbi:MAG TPA: transcription elongation factor GreA [Verrucomicrobiae bacterium]|nr:transcription elongation factor GreA [Verrucomicrobiae bacterium]
MQDKPVPLTRDGHEKLVAELDLLRTARRHEIAERIKHAKEFGDLSENAEYEDAKNEQGFVEGRILTLERMLRNAQIIDEEESPDGTVQIGSTVRVKDEFGDTTYTIVGPAEVDPTAGRISLESPVGKALIGHRSGEAVAVEAPDGPRQVTILQVA